MDCLKIIGKSKFWVILESHPNRRMSFKINDLYSSKCHTIKGPTPRYYPRFKNEETCQLNALLRIGDINGTIGRMWVSLVGYVSWVSLNILIGYLSCGM